MTKNKIIVIWGQCYYCRDSNVTELAWAVEIQLTRQIMMTLGAQIHNNNKLELNLFINILMQNMLLTTKT